MSILSVPTFLSLSRSLDSWKFKVSHPEQFLGTHAFFMLFFCLSLILASFCFKVQCAGSERFKLNFQSSRVIFNQNSQNTTIFKKKTKTNPRLCLSWSRVFSLRIVLINHAGLLSLSCRDSNTLLEGCCYLCDLINHLTSSLLDKLMTYFYCISCSLLEPCWCYEYFNILHPVFKRNKQSRHVILFRFYVL